MKTGLNLFRIFLLGSILCVLALVIQQEKIQELSAKFGRSAGEEHKAQRRTSVDQYTSADVDDDPEYQLKMYYQNYWSHQASLGSLNDNQTVLGNTAQMDKAVSKCSKDYDSAYESRIQCSTVNRINILNFTMHQKRLQNVIINRPGIFYLLRPETNKACVYVQIKVEECGSNSFCIRAVAVKFGSAWAQIDVVKGVVDLKQSNNYDEWGLQLQRVYNGVIVELPDGLNIKVVIGNKYPREAKFCGVHLDVFFETTLSYLDGLRGLCVRDSDYTATLTDGTADTYLSKNLFKTFEDYQFPFRGELCKTVHNRRKAWASCYYSGASSVKAFNSRSLNNIAHRDGTLRFLEVDGCSVTVYRQKCALTFCNRRVRVTLVDDDGKTRVVQIYYNRNAQVKVVHDITRDQIARYVIKRFNHILIRIKNNPMFEVRIDLRGDKASPLNFDVSVTAHRLFLEKQKTDVMKTTLCGLFKTYWCKENNDPTPIPYIPTKTVPENETECVIPTQWTEKPDPDSIPTPVPPACIDFGLAHDFNAVLSRSYAGSSDVQGRLAVNGDAKLANQFSVGDQLVEVEPGTEVTLIVSGEIQGWTTGRNYFGNIVVGKQNPASPISPFILDHNSCVFMSKNFFDFETAYTQLTSLSASLRALKSTFVEGRFDDSLSLKFGRRAPIEVVHVPEGYFNGKVGEILRIDSLDPGAIIVFNVPGRDSGIINQNQEQLQYYQVIFNFYEAKSLIINGVGVRGYVLAPYADINGPGGVVWGSVYAKSLRGPLQLNWVPFVVGPNCRKPRTYKQSCPRAAIPGIVNTNNQMNGSYPPGEGLLIYYDEAPVTWVEELANRPSIASAQKIPLDLIIALIVFVLFLTV